MKIASWNVNSIQTRVDQVIQWLKQNPMDVLGLQELKCQDEVFPIDPFINAGLEVVVSGQKAYNGVALISLKEAEDISLGIAGFADKQKRVIAATFNGIRVVNVYVPNGQAVGSEKFAYKLAWLKAFHHYIEQQLALYPKMVIMGDFNIAPDDRDVYDAEIWQNKILVSPQERQAFQRLLDLGFADSFRLFEQPEHTFSWWDYRMGSIKANRGLRIDHLLISESLKNDCSQSNIDITPRTWQQPSDHAPVWIELEC